MSQHQQTDVTRETAIDTCNSLLRGELAAVETYRHAIGNLAAEAPADLSICLESHERRGMLLAEHIDLAGGTSASSSGLWGAFARAVEGGALLLGRRAVLVALEEGEDQGLTSYRAALDSLDTAGLVLLRADLLPEQIRTHGIMSWLCRRGD